MRALPRASTSAACYQDTPWPSPCAARLGVRSGLKPEALANAKPPQTTRLTSAGVAERNNGARQGPISYPFLPSSCEQKRTETLGRGTPKNGRLIYFGAGGA